MPTDNSVHWKPLRDPHYVLASLQTGGCQPIFAEQKVLVRIQDLVRSTLGRHSLGLLLGDRYDCPITMSTYMVIHSLAEYAEPVRDGDAVADAVAALLAQATADRSTGVLGWYCSNRSQDGRLPDRLAAVYKASFPHASEATLVLGEGASSGAFFLWDSAGSRWYHAPFYEVTEQKPGENRTKPTCIAWPEYMTTDSVVPLSLLHSPPAAPAYANEVSTRRPSLWHLLVASSEEAPRSTTNSTPPSVTEPMARVVSPVGARPPASTEHDEQSRPTLRDAVTRSSKHVTHTDVTRTTGAIKHAIDDSADTSASDTPSRYIDVARFEGFFVAATFDSQSPSKDETLWVLNEPYSGFLLTVVTDASRVLDASLHYNVHTRDAVLLEAAFPEHRDLASGTVYIRESSVDELRARCRRLRATNALQREWRVTPTVSLVTPTEWELGIDDDTGTADAPSTIETLSQQRIGSLPEPVRRQFRLTPRDEGTEPPNQRQDAG
jgi:hypothetical protein